MENMLEINKSYIKGSSLSHSLTYDCYQLVILLLGDKIIYKRAFNKFAWDYFCCK